MYGLYTNEISYVLSQMILYPVLVLATVSFMDDYFELPRITRFFIHIMSSACAIYMVFGFSHTDSYLFNIILGLTLILCSTWSINLFNFMDGLDGLAAVQALSIFFTTGLLLFFQNDMVLGYLSFALAFAVMGFLFWNWPKAKIFMGDVGSTSLGFLIFVFACCAYKRSSLNPVIYFILYLPFIFDATVTMFRRMLYGEKWYHAHKSHAYQRLHAAGWSHQKVLLGFINLCVINFLWALILFFFPRFTGYVLCVEFALIIWIYFKIEKIHPMTRHLIASV